MLYLCPLRQRIKLSKAISNFQSHTIWLSDLLRSQFLSSHWLALKMYFITCNSKDLSHACLLLLIFFFFFLAQKGKQKKQRVLPLSFVNVFSENNCYIDMPSAQDTSTQLWNTEELDSLHTIRLGLKPSFMASQLTTSCLQLLLWHVCFIGFPNNISHCCFHKHWLEKSL